MFVPYAIACSLWKVPVLPVKPWQITLVDANTAGGGGLACTGRAPERVSCRTGPDAAGAARTVLIRLAKILAAVMMAARDTGSGCVP